jgi:hypothetical protein
MVALFATSVGPAHAAVLQPAMTQTYIFNLIQDDSASVDGGNGSVSAQAASDYAVAALEMAGGVRQIPSFTGPVDKEAAAGNAFPAVPLSAAPGTVTDDSVSSTVIGASSTLSALQKQRALGQTRLANFIGTVGNGPPPSQKRLGGTVFVEAGTRPEFNDTSTMAGATRGAGGAYSFASSSTSTATITVAGAGMLSRPGAGGVAYTAVSAGTPVTLSGQDTAYSSVQDEAVQPSFSYTYTPPSNGLANSASMAASFSDSITASGVMARAESTMGGARMTMLIPPVDSVKIQTGQLEPGFRQAGPSENGAIQTSQVQPGAGQSENGAVQTSQVQPGSGQPAAGAVQTSQVQPGSGQAAAGAMQTSQVQPGRAQAGQAANGVQTSQLQSGRGQVGQPANGTMQTSQVQPGRGQSAQPSNGKIQTSQVGQAPNGTDQALRFKSVEAVIQYYKVLEYTQTAYLTGSDTSSDSTHAFVTPSVSADPSAAASHYLMSNLNPAVDGAAVQSAQAFYIGKPAGPAASVKAPTVQEATIPAPLDGKVLASAGPLNSTLALP